MTPQDILQQVRRNHSWAGCYPTVSGQRVDPRHPESLVVCRDDIAYGLAHTYRYGGQIDPPITVAEHSVLVSQIARILWGLDYEAAGLLHDACEAYGHDIRAPLKAGLWWGTHREIASPWGALEDRFTQRIFEAVGVDPQLAHSDAIRASDILACGLEKRASRIFAFQDWGLPDIPKEIWHLRPQGLSPAASEQLFYDTWKQLGLPA